MKCVQCNNEFEPKPKGYNARYCSDRCKRRNQMIRLRLNKPEQLRAARRRSYDRIRVDPKRYEAHLESCRKSTHRVREWLANYKMAHGCIDCGYKKHPAALQLDHEGIKTVPISEARSSIKRLVEEIELGQCVVRCANCHSIKTWKAKQNERTHTHNEAV